MIANRRRGLHKLSDKQFGDAHSASAVFEKIRKRSLTATLKACVRNNAGS